MKFHVIVTPEAQAGIRESFLYIHDRSPLNASRWLQRLYRKIDTLERMPERCSSAREQEYLEEDLRQLVFKPHRIVFQIDKPQKTGWVLWVHHAKRRGIGEPPPEDE